MGGLNSAMRCAAALLVLGAAVASSACRATHGPKAMEVKAACYEKVHAVKARVSADGLRLGLQFVLKGRDAHAFGDLAAVTASPLVFEESSKSIA